MSANYKIILRALIIFKRNTIFLIAYIKIYDILIVHRLNTKREKRMKTEQMFFVLFCARGLLFKIYTNT